MVGIVLFVLLLHDLLYTGLDLLRTLLGGPTSIETTCHAGDHRNEIVYKVVVGITWEDVFDTASLHLHELINVVEPKARSSVSMLNDNDPDRGISKQFRELWTALVETGRKFAPHFRDLLATRSSIIIEALDLPL